MVSNPVELSRRSCVSLCGLCCCRITRSSRTSNIFLGRRSPRPTFFGVGPQSGNRDDTKGGSALASRHSDLKRTLLLDVDAHGTLSDLVQADDKSAFASSPSPRARQTLLLDPFQLDLVRQKKKIQYEEMAMQDAVWTCSNGRELSWAQGLRNNSECLILTRPS